MIDKEKQKEYKGQYYKAHKTHCLMVSKARRDRVGKKVIAEENRYYTQLKKELVLTHYGNGKLACVRCGFNDIRALSIDHISGNGKQDRKRQTGGRNYYSWLIKSNYPDGYQTLCMNCNWIKRNENKEYGKHNVG